MSALLMPRVSYLRLLPLAVLLTSLECLAAPQIGTTPVPDGGRADLEQRFLNLVAPEAPGGELPTSVTREPLLETSLLLPQSSEKPEYYSNLYKRFGLSVGGAALQNFNTSLRVDSDVLVGASLDLENTLGVDDRATVVRLDSFWHWNRRNGIELSYFDIRRSGSRTTAQDINFGQIFVPAGTGVKTTFNTTILKFDYRYNFVADERTVIGASIGLHTMGIDTTLETTTGAAVDEEFKAALPMPLLGLHFEYALSHTWKLISSVELLQLDLGSYSGVISDRRLTIEHNPFKNFGWGLGYNGFSLDAKADGNGSLSARVEYEFQGLMLFARWYM